jgi:methylmalonyl-CoA mutase, N-terminal domain
LWATWMRDHYGAVDPRSHMLRFHTQTAGVSLTAQQPEVNIARTAIEALAGVLGGTQSLHTNSLDEAMALPTERAARIALRTQQVIAHETGVTNVADPLGGSWFVESLTDEMERQASEVFAHLLDLGDGSMLEGVYAGIDNGYFQSEIAESAYRFERAVGDGRRVVVGVNAFTDGDDGPPELLQVSAEQEQSQVGRLARVRAERDSQAVADALDRLRADAADPLVNLMPTLIDVVATNASEGEIMAAMGDVFGTYVETPFL